MLNPGREISATLEDIQKKINILIWGENYIYILYFKIFSYGYCIHCMHLLNTGDIEGYPLVVVCRPDDRIYLILFEANPVFSPLTMLLRCEMLCVCLSQSRVFCI